MNVLSIQSEVVFGHVGNAVAKFALQRLGHSVWAIPTVLLSSHKGYATVTGETVSSALIAALVKGLEANGWLSQCDAVLSGYLGGPEQAEIVADTVRRVKSSRPQALYCLDPVFGDDGRAYAKSGVAEAMARHLLPLADIVTPNAFELSSLSGLAVRDAAEALAASIRLGRPTVLATSVPAGADHIGTLVLENGEAWLAVTPRLAHVPHGAGDLLAALFVSGRLNGRTAEGALETAIRALFHVLEKSVACGDCELPLIAEQDALVTPPPLRTLRIEKMLG